MKVPYTQTHSMRSSFPATGKLTLLSLLLIIYFTGTSCGAIHSMFAPKSGCPSDGRNVGAERILSGEKVPKAKKFKA